MGHRADEVLAGRPARWLLLTASVLAGLLLAVLTVRQGGVWLGQHTMFGGGYRPGRLTGPGRQARPPGMRPAPAAAIMAG